MSCRVLNQLIVGLVSVALAEGWRRLLWTRYQAVEASSHGEALAAAAKALGLKLQYPDDAGPEAQRIYGEHDGHFIVIEHRGKGAGAVCAWVHFHEPFLPWGPPPSEPPLQSVQVTSRGPILHVQGLRRALSTAIAMRGTPDPSPSLPPTLAQSQVLNLYAVAASLGLQPSGRSASGSIDGVRVDVRCEDTIWPYTVVICPVARRVSPIHPTPAWSSWTRRHAPSASGEIRFQERFETRDVLDRHVERALMRLVDAAKRVHWDARVDLEDGQLVARCPSVDLDSQPGPMQDVVLACVRAAKSFDYPTSPYRDAGPYR